VAKKASKKKPAAKVKRRKTRPGKGSPRVKRVTTRKARRTPATKKRAKRRPIKKAPAAKRARRAVSRKPAPKAKRRAVRRGPTPKKVQAKRTVKRSRVVRATRGAGRKRTPGPKGGGPIARRTRAVEEALDVLGPRRVRKGRVRLGQTGWLTPTVRGLAAFDAALVAIRGAGPGKTFSMDLEIQFLGANGVRKTIRLQGVGVPRAKDIVRKAGERAHAAFLRTVRELVRRQVFGAVNVQLGGTSNLGREVRLKMSRKKAQAALRKAKRTRGVRFRATFYRET